jgi:hypothetical protein
VHLNTVNNAAKKYSVKLEQERTLILTPISAIALEILISFPWRWNTNQQTNNAVHETAN